MRGWLWAGVLTGGLVLADWGLGQGMALWLRDAFARAPTAGVAAVAATGFPTRIGVRLDGPWVRPSGAEAVWAAQRATVSAQVWTPLRWTLDLPLPQQVTLQGLRFALTGTTATLRLDLAPGADLPLDRIGLRLAGPALTYEAAAAPSLAAETVDLALQATETAGLYQLSGQSVGPSLPPGLAAALGRKAALPDRIERLDLAAELRFDRPLALLDPRPAALTAVDLQNASLLWDGHRISLSGRLTVTPEGWPEGTLTIALSDFTVWLDLGLAAGLLPPERRAMLSAMGDYLARQSPDGSVRLPLSFANGAMTLAAIPLGPAPKLPQRQ